MNQPQSPHVKLALYTIQEYSHTGIMPVLPSDVSEKLTGRRAGVFVSLHKRGELRGCIGTIEPTTGSIAEEIMSNAVNAGYRDYRFEPLDPGEIPELECSVDVLEPAEPVKDIAELNPKTYGVIVKQGSRKGLLLPDLDGVDTVEQQISIALRKAGISEKEGYELLKFKVTRYH